MAALVDTSILIDHLRGHDDARALLAMELARGEPLYASVLTKVEIMAGMRGAEAEATRSLLDVFIWVEVTGDIAEKAGRLAARFRRSHGGVDVVDYVVAATQQDLGVSLWTRNVRHFPMLPRLRPPY